MKNKSIMIQGTASSVGKSILVAGLCRVLMQDGYKVAPFKSQNMALNSFITQKGNEMGRAQVVQAEAAGVEPTVEMNPILLKPSADKMAQVIIDGKVYKNMTAMEYHEYKPTLKNKIQEIYHRLSEKNDYIVLEGAGSPAEINLRENDIVNMGMAEISDSPVILVGDIDRGGVFASLYGTYELLTPEEKKRIKGVIINKFRGDKKILEPGLRQLEDLIDVPVLGVMPYLDLKIEDEDSVSRRFYEKNNSGDLDIEVLYLPHVSNFTDFNVFETMEDVNLNYVMRGEEITSPDVLIIPGSKNTIEDLMYLRNTGLEEQILRASKNGTIIVGICGGYQMLGNTLSDPYQTETRLGKVNGMGLLDIDTVFEKEKTTTQVTGKVITEKGPLLKDLSNCLIKGYEIHMGQTSLNEMAEPWIELETSLGKKVTRVDGAVNKDASVIGTYIHGIFDEKDFSRKWINNIRQMKGLDKITTKDSHTFEEFKQQEYDKLAKAIRENLALDRIYKILNGEEDA